MLLLCGFMWYHCPSACHFAAIFYENIKENSIRQQQLADDEQASRVGAARRARLHSGMLLRWLKLTVLTMATSLSNDQLAAIKPDSAQKARRPVGGAL